MTFLQRASVPALLQAGLAAAVFVLFASLALRHVGESVFLVDQADQLQFFERFLRLDPTGLWGPIMSSPDPPTRSVGPLGAWLFGIPVALGFGVDAVQSLTSVLLVLSALAAFLALARIDARFAWVWLLLLLANGIVWWNAGMLWANTAMLPAGNLLLACIALCLRAPTLARLLAVWFVVVFAAQISLVAVTAVPPAAVVTLRTWRSAWRHRPRWPLTAVLVALAVLAVGPYLLAEAMTGFTNTRAMLAHAGGSGPPEGTDPREYGLAVLAFAADPAWVMRRADAGAGTAIGVGTAVVLAALLVGALRLRRTLSSHAAPDSPVDTTASGPSADRTMVWLVAVSLVGIIGQAAFFMLEHRALLSYHYISMLLPLYGVPPAALAAWVLAGAPARLRELAAVGLGVACVVVVWRHGPEWADRYFERTDWTYTRIAGAVNELCETAGSARTVEGPGFDSLMPGHDGVVTYLMTRRFVPCRYDPASDRLIAASREGGYEPARQEPDGTFRLVKVAAPGIALYRREGAAPNQ